MNLGRASHIHRLILPLARSGKLGPRQTRGRPVSAVFTLSVIELGRGKREGRLGLATWCDY